MYIIYLTSLIVSTGHFKKRFAADTIFYIMGTFEHKKPTW